MSLTDFHGYQSSVKWRLTAHGVEIQGSGIERTLGEPQTVRNLWERFHGEINAAAQQRGVPCVLIVATIATEARIRNGQADPNSVRKEPGYTSDNGTPDRISAGLMQTLISTARSAMGSPAIDRQWLLNPANSIMAGTAYIAQQKPKTEFDPPKVAAAYNAGGVYHQTGQSNRWKMRQYPIGTGEHCDRFVRWFNDAVAVLDNHPIRPAVPYSVLIAGVQPEPRPEPVVRRSAVVVLGPGVVVESDECKAVIEYLRQSGVPCRVTSAKRSTLPSDHAKLGTNGTGLAVDFGGPRPGLDTQEMADIFNALAKVAPQLDELIYAGPQVKQNVKLGKWVGKYAQKDHHNHVHVSVPRGVFIKWPGGPVEQEDEVIRIVKTTSIDGREILDGVYAEINFSWVSWIPTEGYWNSIKAHAVDGRDQPVLLPRNEFDKLEKVGQGGWPDR